MKKNLLLVPLLLLVRHTSNAATQAPAQNSSSVRAGQPFAPSGNQLYDDLLGLIKNNRESTIDGFLKQLSQRSEFATNAKSKALFYHSRSRHESSFENPRALVMFGTGELVISFNGAPEQRLFDGLEVMGYNKHTGEFEFRDIIFKKEPAKNPNLVTTEVDFENEFVRVRKPNSSLCVDCHGYETAKPQWSTYLAWPGSYGSYEESFALAETRYARDTKATELNKLIEFENQSTTKDRYRRFPWGRSENRIARFLSDTRFGIMLNYRMGHAALKEALGRLNQPQATKFKYAFAGYLLGCTESFVPSRSAVMGGDRAEDLTTLMSSMMSSRVHFEIHNRQMMSSDLVAAAGVFTWKPGYGLPPLPYSIRLNSSQVPRELVSDPSAPLATASALTSRPDSILKFARLENLYKAMQLGTDLLHLQNSATSWDGYNEIQDFMSDYLLKYYDLPAVTAINKLQAEAVEGLGPRNDLNAPLLDSEYMSLKPAIEALQLPAAPAAKAQLCTALANASQTALAH